MSFQTPFGAQLFNKCLKRSSIDKRSFYRALILATTFICYFSFHVARRPFSIVKSVFHHDNCSEVIPPNGTIITNETSETWCDWAPFDNKNNAKSLLGLMDTTYLFAYAISMFFAGFIAERCNLRYFLTISMIVVGFLNFLLGITYYYNIHALYYYIIVQLLSGIANTCGWPAVVAVVGNWFGSAKSGTIFGIWNAHTSLGNIVGAAVAGAFVDHNWGLSFIVPGLIIVFAGIIMFFFLVPKPEDVGLKSVNDYEEHDSDGGRKRPDVVNEGESSHSEAISFIGALKIPGVIEFSICLFFAKLVSYTFLYWLPLYINTTTHSSAEESAYLSISFDIGGVVGGILAGFARDKTGASALTCVVMLAFAIPSLFLYYLFGTDSPLLNEGLQFIAGILVNGPYALITTAVSAELGTLIESKSALATVSAIIDGTGSIGAAVGPSLAGVISEIGWKWVFYFMMLADLLAMVSLFRISKNEWKRLRTRKTFPTFSENSTDSLCRTNTMSTVNTI